MAKDKLGTNAGQYYTECGRLGTGKQPRFYLGRTDDISEDTARVRRTRLRSFWERCQQGERSERERGVWLDSELGWARQIAKGATTIVLETNNPAASGLSLTVIAKKLELLNRRFAGIAHFLVPQAVADFAASVTDVAKQGAETPAEPGGPTVHQYLDKYAQSIRDSLKEYDEETNAQEATEWAGVFSEAVERLKEHRTDLPLLNFDNTAIEATVIRLANRPVSGKTGRPISVKYAKHLLKAFRRFIRWLPKHSSWRKPEDWEDVFADYRPKPTQAEKSERPVGRVKSYSAEQLEVIYRYATPFERCLFLLAVNCGFGAAEISGLRRKELELNPEGDSYIKRVRVKTAEGVYGEHWLFPHTVLALRWAVARATRIKGDLKPASFVVVRDSGLRLVTRTKSGNRSNKAANAWQRLTSRITADEPSFPKLSFGKLRKTAGNLIYEQSNLETVAVFHQRSSAEPKDDEAEVYTDRRYDRVHDAQRKVSIKLQKMFEAVPDPFPERTTKNQIGRKKIDLIKSLWAEGRKVDDIVRAAAASRATVYRYRPQPDRPAGLHGDTSNRAADESSGGALAVSTPRHSDDVARRPLTEPETSASRDTSGVTADA